MCFERNTRRSQQPCTYNTSSNSQRFFFIVIYSMWIRPNRNTLQWMYTIWLSKGKLLFLYVLRETHLCPARLNTGCPFYLSRVTALRPSVLRKAVELFSGNWTHNIQKNMYTVRLLLIIEQCTVHTYTWFSISSTIFIRP